MLTETDLVKILGNSFLSDFDPNNRKVKLPEEEVIRAAVTAAEAQAGTPAKHLDEITMFDIGEYFRAYFSTGVEAFTRAGYWDALTRFGHRLPTAARIKLYALLWGNLEDFTRLFILLHDALEKLQHAPQARASLEALEPRETSIIDVQILLKSLDTPQDAKDLIAVVPELGGEDGAPVKIPRAVLTALVAEIKVVIAEKPWEFFEHTDLLDFPGARSRSKLIELPGDKEEREEVLRHMILRGKIAYLFQRYTEERELTCMMLLHAAVRCRGEGSRRHGARVGRSDARHDRRAAHASSLRTLSRADQVRHGLHREGGRHGGLAARQVHAAPGRLVPGALRARPVGAGLGRPALSQYRVPAQSGVEAAAHHSGTGDTNTLADGSEQRIEAAIAPEAAPRLEEYKAGFLQSADCQKHFSDRERVWDSAFRLNDGGVAYLVSRLEQVLARRSNRSSSPAV